jgi:6-phospho-beta-glucosidase
MKLTIIGAGGVRTPLVVQSLLHFADRLPLSRVSFMDIDAERLELVQLACKPWLTNKTSFEVEWTVDARRAIGGSDFIVTTFRVGGMESRVIDEQVPLKYGVIGQETTGPGGFAMALRTIPVMLDYVRLVQDLAPAAWLLNFTNPAGIITEAIYRIGGFDRVAGICDNPAAMLRSIAGSLNTPPERLFPEYYGLNHLGWLKAVFLDGQDQIPGVIRALKEGKVKLDGLPFDLDLVEALEAIPNEYLYFFYSPQECVQNLQQAGESRAGQIMPFNLELFSRLRQILDEESPLSSIEEVYARYLNQRHGTYMSLETGGLPHPAGDPGSPGSEIQPAELISESAEGYSAVALNVIQALVGAPAPLILNVPNRGALPGMDPEDVVEVTCYVGQGVIRPLAFGQIPDHALGLMKSVKAYERLTIQAVLENSYSLAVQALASHPLVPSYPVARAILEDYLRQHGDYFPRLS